MSKIEEHLKEEVRGTAEGCDMLHLPVSLENHYAANTYLVALHEITALRAQIEAQDVEIKRLREALEIAHAALEGKE